jgi:hypothetical protein
MECYEQRLLDDKPISASVLAHFNADGSSINKDDGTFREVSMLQ